METFADTRELVDDIGYPERRERALAALDLDAIDLPIRDIVRDLAALSHCFTLQCCCGHFVYAGQDDSQNLAPLPAEDVGAVRYRIAYLALCLRYSENGRRLLGALSALTEVDSGYVQFGSPGWFWCEHPNSYALQVEPERFRDKDEALVGYNEALRIQQVRNEFFERLRDVVARESTLAGAG